MKDTVVMQFQMAKWALDTNLEGLDHEQSLAAPQPAGNSANWVVGHLLSAYDNLLKAIGKDPVADTPAMDPYRRGCEPLDPAGARSLTELRADLEVAHDRVVEAVAGLSEEDLAQASPVSPRNDPNETIGSFIGLLAFHQSYHVGQLGVLRRVAGENGAIA